MIEEKHNVKERAIKKLEKGMIIGLESDLLALWMYSQGALDAINMLKKEV